MLRKLYPGLSDDELLITEEKFDEYLEFTLRLYRRIVLDPEAYRKFKLLTGKGNDFTIDSERSKKHNDSFQT